MYLFIIGEINHEETQKKRLLSTAYRYIMCADTRGNMEQSAKKVG